MSALCYSYLDSPVGRLLLAGDESALHFVSFPTGSKAFGPRPEWRAAEAPFSAAKAQLAEYFAGERRAFDLPLKLTGTEFQRQVWTILPEIPFGRTWTYGELARALNKPLAVRAVGAANGRNPLPIILPCHRVIGANGALTGFGGGLATKDFLLRHEAGALGPEADAGRGQLRLL